MPDSVLGVGHVVDLLPVPVDDDGNLFVSPVIHDWNIVTQRGIDTVVDLEGGLDVGVPTAPNECPYLYSPIFDEALPNLNKLHSVACQPPPPGVVSLRHGTESVGAGGRLDPA